MLQDTLINCGRSVTALTMDSTMPNQLAVGCCDGYVSIYDRRMISTPAISTISNTPSSSKGLLCRFTVPGFEDRSHRITSLAYSSNGAELLASFSSEYVYLFNVKVRLLFHFWHIIGFWYGNMHVDRLHLMYCSDRYIIYMYAGC